VQSIKGGPIEVYGVNGQGFQIGINDLGSIEITPETMSTEELTELERTEAVLKEIMDSATSILKKAYR